MWEKESISDYHCLYVRVHHNNIKPDGTPSVSSFSNTPKHEDNLSSDWCKYCSPFTSRELIRRQKNQRGENKNPAHFYMWVFNILSLRNMDFPQKVEHDPLYNEPEIDGQPNNRAHSKIIGSKLVNNAEFKRKMLRCGKWVIGPTV